MAGILCILLALALSSHAYDPSENQKIILFLTDNSGPINEFKVVRDNVFYRSSIKYQDAYTIPDEYVETPPKLEIKDPQGNTLYKDAFLSSSYAPYYENANKITLYDGRGNIMFEKTISFCNNNGQCEPCEGIDCAVSENSASCNDCPSGGKDLYCDLKRDSICDPDCVGMDADCPGCDQRPCYYEDSIDENNACTVYGGEVCNTIEECSGDAVTYGSGGICCIGTCVNPASLSALEEEAQQQPAEEIIFNGASDPQGQNETELADPVEIFDLIYNKSLPVEDQSKKIFCKNVGKSACGEFEKCTGQKVYSDDEGYDCCTGSCVPLPDDEANAVYREKFGEEYKKPALEQPVQVEEIMFVPPEAQPANLASSFLIGIAVVSIILLSFVVLHRRKQRQETAKYEYDYYRKYGYNDEQTKKILGDRGWKEKEIEKAAKTK